MQILFVATVRLKQLWSWTWFQLKRFISYVLLVVPSLWLYQELLILVATGSLGNVSRRSSCWASASDRISRFVDPYQTRGPSSARSWRLPLISRLSSSFPTTCFSSFVLFRAFRLSHRYKSWKLQGGSPLCTKKGERQGWIPYPDRWSRHGPRSGKQGSLSSTKARSVHYR